MGRYMPPLVSRRWLGTFGALSVMVLARCGGVPDLPSGGGLQSIDTSGGGQSSANGGSVSLNTGGNSNGDSGGCGNADCGEAGSSDAPRDVCGDGVVGKSEECDDGNAKPGDGCSGVCKIDPGYDCPKPGAACKISASEVCGDGSKGMHEACDDGNAQNNDGCSSQCEIEPGYSCDPSSGVCTPDAAPPVCGNGLVESSESCDDGNTVGSDGCSASCATELGFDCVSAGEACEPAAYCGDGILQVSLGEDCDDANRKPGDGCNASCFTEKGYLCTSASGTGEGGAGATGPETCTKIWVCGNGRVDPHEACDDGNTTALDGCSASCAVEAGYTCPKDPTTSAGGKCSAAAMSVCGNAIVESNEYCDDGNPTNNDGCTACHIDAGYSCPTAGVACTQNERCGDGTVDLDLNEQCDDGNTTPGDGCGALCKIEPNYTCLQAGALCTSTIVCGDGLIAGTEQCDDGNKLSTDGCNSTCQLEAGWACPVAATRCVAKACGDGIRVGNEQCDDHNTTALDGCSPTCKLEPGFSCSDSNALTSCRATVCGDGTQEGFEQCDDHNLIPYDGCSPSCTREPSCANGTCTAVCGDGLKFSQEDCDDGNTTPGDGCSATCTIETGFSCSVVEQSPAATLDIPILYRDFLYADTDAAVGPGHIDFQKYSGSAQTTGLVQSALGSDGEPVFLSTNGSGQYGQQLTDATHFYWWYHQQDCTSTPCTNNPYDKLVYQTRAGQPTTLTFTKQDTGAYLYSTSAFFPIDDLGWVNSSNQSVQTYSNHNFAFTSELRYQFTYQGGEVLDFTGDDDVWVFINGKLAVDLGGLHPPTNGSVTLDDAHATTLGLTKGQMYGIVLFQAERHTDGSNYKLTLNGFVHAISQCVAKCGDGILEGNEVCDDGKNDGSYGSCATDCQSRGPYCGDSKTQSPQETCDNGVNSVTGYGNTTAQCAPGCKLAPYCGDGVTSNGEECDDAGNNGKGYGYCLTGCKLGDRCGDGKKNGAEQCDDGANNGSSGSSCEKTCTLKCGNGKPDTGEQCDLGTALNTGAYDGCNADCSVGPYCGDGFQSNDEVCDDGKNDGSYGTCNPGCKSANYCGDGKVTSPPELCDLGASNTPAAYGRTTCTARCLPGPYCGDKAVQGGFGEKCDDGKNDGTPGSCTSDCKAFVALSSCGNGALDAQEQCDHGTSNGKAGDTCDAHCRFRCGNGSKESGEACDDGVNNGAYGTCKPDCTLAAYCGDGLKNGSEACDDGAKNVALASAYGKTVCTSVCSKAPYCGDGHVQSAFEDCDGTANCSATCTSSVLH
jgi:fibro-slime domain-containing protein